MPDPELVEVRARGVCADCLDVIRPLARRHGYRHTTTGAIRFAVDLAAAITRYANRDGSVPGFPEDFRWPRSEHRGQGHPSQQLPPGEADTGTEAPEAPQFDFP